MNAEGVGQPGETGGPREALLRDIACGMYSDLPQDLLRSLYWVAEGKSWPDVARKLSVLEVGKAAELSVIWGWQERHLIRLMKGEQVPDAFWCEVPGRNITSRWNEDLELFVLRYFLPSFAHGEKKHYMFKERFEPKDNSGQTPDFRIVVISPDGSVLPDSGIGVEVTQGTTEEVQEKLTRKSKVRGPHIELLDSLPVRLGRWADKIYDSIERKLQKGYDRNEMLQRSDSCSLFLVVYPNTDESISGQDYDAPHEVIRQCLSARSAEPFDRICLVYSTAPFVVWVR